MTDKPKRGRPKLYRPPKIAMRPKRLHGSEFVGVRIDAALAAKLDTICKARKETRSQAIRSLIDQFPEESCTQTTK